jgi:hypothetical protein
MSFPKNGEAVPLAAPAHFDDKPHLLQSAGRNTGEQLSPGTSLSWENCVVDYPVADASRPSAGNNSLSTPAMLQCRILAASRA